MKRKSTTDDFIRKAIKIHGDKYDYTESIYFGSDKKISIICKNHGKFSQKANGHLNGKGCSKCGRIKANKSESLTQEKFLQKSIKIHSYKYDYSKVNYTKNNEKVEIICKNHGPFYQKPNDHTTGQIRGLLCVKCNSGIGCFNEDISLIDKVKKYLEHYNVV